MINSKKNKKYTFIQSFQYLKLQGLKVTLSYNQTKADDPTAHMMIIIDSDKNVARILKISIVMVNHRSPFH